MSNLIIDSLETWYKEGLLSFKDVIRLIQGQNNNTVNEKPVHINEVLEDMAAAECISVNQAMEQYKHEVCEIMKTNKCSYYQARDIHEILYKKEYDK